MTNSSFNLGVFSSFQVFLGCLVFFSIVLSHADIAPPSDIVSTICPTTTNSSLCLNVLKLAGSTDAQNLANVTLDLAQTSTAEGLRHARRLEATRTANPQLTKRYSECARRFELLMRDIEEGKEALATGAYVLLKQAVTAAAVEANGCLDTFKQPPRETSSLPKKAKYLGDIFNIVVRVSTILAGDDY